MNKTKVQESQSGDQPEKFGRDQLLEWYSEMLLVRRFEERCSMLYGQQKIQGFLHLYIGQEAISSGVQAAMRADDYLITAYRDHGNAITRGIDPNAVMAELFGKKTGIVKGKGGSMHMFSKELNMLGGHGIVGAHIPLAAGIGFGIQYLKEEKVCVCLFGDGAARQGALHESFNLSMLWNVPVVYICENNQYAMGTSVDRTSNVTDIYKLGCAYEMPSEQIDGMDVMAVHDAVKEAVEAARDGGGPTLLEARTYRYRGHSISDPALYRNKDELQEHKDIDPILRLKHHMLEQKLATDDEFTEIDNQCKARVKEAIEFAENSDFPAHEDIYEDVYIGDYPFMKD